MSFNYNFYFFNFNTNLKNIITNKNYFLLIIDVISFKKPIVLRAFLYKTASKLKKLKTNFEDKISFIIKISKCELINSASENENNGP